MRHLYVLLLLCLSWTCGQNLNEDERKRWRDIFWTEPTPTTTEGEGGYNENDRKRLGDIFGTKPTPTTTGGGFDEDERKRLGDIFGTKPTSTTTEGGFNENDRKRLGDIFGTKPTPTPTGGGLDRSPIQTRAEGPFIVKCLYFNITSPQIDRAGNLTECNTAAGPRGVCVPHYQCNPDTGTVVNNTDILNMGIRDCPHYLQVCCLFDEVRVKPRTPVVVAEECGWPNPGAQAFRINNDEPDSAEFGDFPWMVALLKRSDSTTWSQSDYLGGGSIIHPSVVLTVAHKVNGRLPSELKCRAGEYDTQTELELYPHQERNVKKIVQHADYYRPSVRNSIALLILEAPYDFSNAPHMGVACVSPRPPTPGTLCYSMGWGKEFASKDKYAVKLKKIQLPIIARDKCQQALRNTRLGMFFELHSSLTCAGGQAGRDTCLGDGGSPLVCPIGNVDPGKVGSRYMIAGMVAWGIGCGIDLPGVYVNTPSFYDWIAQRMREEGFDTSSYTY